MRWKASGRAHVAFSRRSHSHLKGGTPCKSASTQESIQSLATEHSLAVWPWSKHGGTGPAWYCECLVLAKARPVSVCLALPGQFPLDFGSFRSHLVRSSGSLREKVFFAQLELAASTRRTSLKIARCREAVRGRWGAELGRVTMAPYVMSQLPLWQQLEGQH